MKFSLGHTHDEHFVPRQRPSTFSNNIFTTDQISNKFYQKHQLTGGQKYC